MKIIKNINQGKVSEYLLKNKDRSIQDVYDEIKGKKFKSRSLEESLVFAYLCSNRKKLNIK